MKKRIAFGLFFVLSAPFCTLLAQDLPSCDELVEIADIFDEVAEVLEDVGYIPENSELDRALGEVVDALEELVDVEENRSLTNSVRQLADAWEILDWEKFKLALDSMIANLDRIRRADCN